MIEYRAAIDCLLTDCALLPSEYCALDAAAGRVLAESITSRVDLPPFDNSAMDGFALRGAGATLAAGSEFAVSGAQAAGDASAATSGEAWEIMTGASVPFGLDTVVPVEQVTVLQRDGAERPTRIRLLAAVPPGQHLRRAGEDLRAGAMAINAGTLLGPQHLMLLAAIGVDRLSVRRRPKVAVINTGRELMDDPAAALAEGAIRNSNGPFLVAALAQLGAEVVLRETVPDQPDAFVAVLERALAAAADIVISSGAVSMGRYDFVPATLMAGGAHIGFHKVAIRPGKPLLFARLAGGVLFFGLPGNPISCAVGLRFFVAPALRAITGLDQERSWRLPLRSAQSKKSGFRHFLKARIELDFAGQPQARVLDGQESFRIQPLALANAWVVLPEAATDLPAGSLVEVVGLSAPWLADLAGLGGA